MITMVTTIQVSKKLRETLELRKMHSKESYEAIIWDLLEDDAELTKETKKELEEARKEIETGRVKSLAQVKKELGIQNV